MARADEGPAERKAVRLRRERLVQHRARAHQRAVVPAGPRISSVPLSPSFSRSPSPSLPGSPPLVLAFASPFEVRKFWESCQPRPISQRGTRFGWNYD
jgi:hypothetical protein